LQTSLELGGARSSCGLLRNPMEEARPQAVRPYT
jgi:hypothetical protein